MKNAISIIVRISVNLYIALDSMGMVKIFFQSVNVEML